MIPNWNEQAYKCIYIYVVNGYVTQDTEVRFLFFFFIETSPKVNGLHASVQCKTVFTALANISLSNAFI